MAEKDVLLKVEDVHKSYGQQKVLRGVSFTIKEGTTTILCGPSGGGKSTLLTCLNLITKPDKGQVWLEGMEITNPSVDIHKVRQKIGFVFQSFNLFTHLTALRNVSIGLERVKKVKREEAREIAFRNLKEVGLEEHVNKYPAQLSGGQKQRVAIARALAMDPVIIFYDEPTSALDPALIGEVLEIMRKLAQKVTSLVVTHEIGFALAAGSNLLFMCEGKIVEQGAPCDVIRRPKCESAKRFFGSISELYESDRS
jgi:polar amino acid transport system ATP-binding protein